MVFVVHVTLMALSGKACIFHGVSALLGGERNAEGGTRTPTS